LELADLETGNVLVGVLGAGKYVNVNYQLRGRSVFTYYATYALKKILEESGVHFDEVFLFGTSGSNWSVAEDLFEVYKRVIVPEGKGESELKDTYMIFFEELSRCRSITLDLTHAFRHLSQLLLIVAYYLDLLGKTKIEGIYYGLLTEPREGASATIVDLKPLLTSLRTLFNVEIFRRTLKVSGLDPILNDLELYAQQAAGREEKELFSSIRSVLKALKTLGLYVSCNYTPGIVDKSRDISEMTKKLTGTVEKTYPYILPSLKALIDETDKLASLGKNSLWITQLELARKCLELDKYTSAIINLREGFLTYACHELSDCQQKESCREKSNCACYELREAISQRLLSSRGKGEPQTFQKYAKNFDRIAQLRNKIVHGYIARKDDAKPNLHGEIAKLLEDSHKMMITENSKPTKNS